MMGCYVGNLSVIELLLQNGGNVMSIDTQNRGVLHYSVCFQHKDAIKYLVGKGVDLTAKDKDGFTALDLAEKLLSDDEVRIWLSPKD